MSSPDIDFSKYEAQASPSIDFSKYEQSQPANPQGGPMARFLTRATGLPASDIASHPGKYLNPFSKDYQQAARDNANQPVNAPSLRQMTPFGQTSQDISHHDWPEVAGDLLPGVLAAAQLRFAKLTAPASATVRALPAGAIEMPAVPAAQEMPSAPAFSNTTRAQRLNLLLPERTPSSSAVPLPESSLPTETQQGYPGALQSRPQGRAEVVDDKIVQDRMRADLDKHGWNALSEEKQMYYANNAPQFTKRQLIAQEQARALMEQAQGQAQNILEQARIAAETPAKYTKTVTPKAPVSAAAKPQPITQGLDVNQDLTDILQRSLDTVRAQKAK